jgi:adenylate cyclase
VTLSAVAFTVSERQQRRHANRWTNAARELNRHPALVEPARRLRESVMGGERVAGRLLATLGRPTELAGRELAALTTESRGLLEELGLTGAHAWQRASESQGRGRGVRDVAVLFTDLVGFSAWALESGDTLVLGLLSEVIEAVEPPILERNGDVVKRLGDGLMAVFDDAPSAVDAAFEARERVGAIDADGYRPQLRIGIHLGRPRKLGGDYVGVDVNIAARLLEAAKPGQILISDRTLRALDTAIVTATSRPFSAAGVPADLTAHVVDRPAELHSDLGR